MDQATLDNIRATVAAGAADGIVHGVRDAWSIYGADICGGLFGAVMSGYVFGAITTKALGWLAQSYTEQVGK